MKKITFLAFVATFLGVFVPTPKAIAGEVVISSPRSRILHVCSHCRKPVYAFYRPVRYINQHAVYAWVPSAHTCRHRNSVVHRSVISSPRLSVRTNSPTVRRVYQTPRTSITIQNGYSPRFYATSPVTRYSSLRTSPTLRFYRSSGCR